MGKKRELSKDIEGNEASLEQLKDLRNAAQKLVEKLEKGRSSEPNKPEGVEALIFDLENLHKKIVQGKKIDCNKLRKEACSDPDMGDKIIFENILLRLKKDYSDAEILGHVLGILSYKEE